MYVRGCVDRFGRQVSVPGPAANICAVCQTTDVAPLPARTMFVATTSISTRAGRARRKCTTARSRKPSPFGLTVVSRRPSPANGVDPFVTWRSCSAGESASAASPSAVTATPPARLQFPYVPLNLPTHRTSILTSDEATPHLCRACAGVGPARRRRCALVQLERRDALREGRARDHHDSGSRRCHRQPPQRQRPDQT